MHLRACFPTVTLTTLVLLAPCLAGEFGQTRQYFAPVRHWRSGRDLF